MDQESGLVGRALRVLVVDDNRDAADSLCLLLRAWGHDARVAYNGTTGLQTALEFTPDCLFLDIAMPGMDGYTLACLVRDQVLLRRARLVALSAYSSEEHARRAEQAGFDYLLTKPADLNQLQRLLTMMRMILGLAGEPQELLLEVKEEAREVNDSLAQQQDQAPPSDECWRL